MDWTELTLFLYILARISGFVLFNPVLGRRSIPGSFRTGFILVLSVAVISYTQPQFVPVPTSLVELGIKLLMELLLGFFLGMVMQFFFYIPQLAGEVIDTQMGMTMNQIYDSGSQSNMSVTGVVLNVLMTLLFFVANGHHTLLRIMMTSGEIIPFGTAVPSTKAYDLMLELFIQYTILAVKLCLPILAAELVGQLGMGVLMKVIPQINVFSINIELKVIIGLVLLFMLISPFSEFFLQAEMVMLDDIRRVLALA